MNGLGLAVVILALAVLIAAGRHREGTAVSLEPSTNQPPRRGALDRCK